MTHNLSYNPDHISLPEQPALPEQSSGSVPPPRQTTAYLKDLFAQVGFSIDTRRGQNFLVDLNLLDLLAR